MIKNKFSKCKSFTIFSLLACLIVFASFSIVNLGCSKTEISQDSVVEYSKYSAFIGESLGYIIHLGDAFSDDNVKEIVLNVSKEIETKLPKELTPEVLKNEIRNITSNALVKIEIPDASKKALIEVAVNAASQMLVQSIDLVLSKYPTDCKNTEAYYSMVMTCISSFNSTLSDLIVPRLMELAKASPDSKILDISKVDVKDFDSVNEFAKTKFGKDLNKDAYEDLLNNLKPFIKRIK